MYKYRTGFSTSYLLVSPTRGVTFGTVKDENGNTYVIENSKDVNRIVGFTSTVMYQIIQGLLPDD